MKPMKKHTIKQAGTLRSLLLLFGLALGSGLSAQDAAAVLDAVRRQHAPDRRVAVFEIEAERINDTLHILKGKCDDPEAIEALRAAFRGAGIRFADYVKALPDASLKEKNEALVTLSSINLRTAPDHAAEMSTQAIMGTPLRVLEQYDNWYRVQTPDGYIGWTNAASIALKTAEETKRWRSAARYVYTGYTGSVYAGPDLRSGTVSDLVLGSVLEADTAAKSGRKFASVRLPDGRSGYVLRREIEDFETWASRPLDPDGLERTAPQDDGSPLSVGRHVGQRSRLLGHGEDGLLRRRHRHRPRRVAASAHGERLAPSEWPRCLKGDLIFFGNPASGRVTHVAMYLGEGRFIHSAGRVKINSLDPVGRRLSADELSVDQPNRNADRNARHHGGPLASMVFRHPITTHPNPIWTEKNFSRQRPPA